jgi:hypothetical protein
MRFWKDGQIRHNYNTDDMEHRVPELVEFATTVIESPNTLAPARAGPEKKLGKSSAWSQAVAPWPAR